VHGPNVNAAATDNENNQQPQDAKEDDNNNNNAPAGNSNINKNKNKNTANKNTRHDLVKAGIYVGLGNATGGKHRGTLQIGYGENTSGGNTTATQGEISKATVNAASTLTTPWC